MTQADLDREFELQVDSTGRPFQVSGFNRPVLKYLRKDELQLVQVSPLTGEVRCSRVAQSRDELVTCNQAEWEPLE